MNRALLVVFLVAVGIYLPTVRYTFVQDDRAILASNPGAHSIPAAVRAFNDPYWPPETGLGMYRPFTVLTFAVDWTISNGRPGWLHFMNAAWHGLVAVLLVVLVARWVPLFGAVAAGLVFAWHPVHVEAVANIVGRAELLVAAGILGAVLAARRRRWIVAGLCAALAMLSKEHGVIAGVVILLDRWLQRSEDPPYPIGFWAALIAVTVAYLAVWLVIGSSESSAANFLGKSAAARLAIALPAIQHAAWLLVWPASLSIEYGPQVLPMRTGFSLAALLGAIVALGVPVLVFWCRARAPAVAFAAGVAALSYLPTSNLLFASGVVLAERNLYLAVALPAVLVAIGALWLSARHGLRPAALAVSVVVVACAARSLARLPAWRDNRAQLLTMLTEHPEAYRPHGSAAAVLAGMGDTAGARREYRIADSLFSGDPYLDLSHATFLFSIGDTAQAIPLVERADRPGVAQRLVLRGRFLTALARAHYTEAGAIADSASRRYEGEQRWYLQYRK